MRCGNDFCIYFSDYKCLRDDITLDTDGRCEQCMYVNISEDVLEEARERLRAKYESF